ncbi:helix-turn-helix domain-containing protein [Shimia sp. MIT910701]|uniref:helix-turn-helix domain-containing protein n=1 Tax=Shimia sp. MIT910701 TaxID=3096987 RepID=UPI00399A0539
MYKRSMERTFRDAFLVELGASGLSVAEVARRSGVSKDQLNKLKQRDSAKTNVDDARRVAEAFGKTLDQFLKDTETSPYLEAVGLLSQLSEEEREFIIVAARAAVDKRKKR